MEHPDHCFFLQSKDGALGHRCRRGHAKRLSREASFTKEISAPQDCDDRFLPPRGEDRQLHLALLDVKHRVRGIALREDDGFLLIPFGGSPPGFRKVRPEIEWGVPLLCHVSAPRYERGFRDTQFNSAAQTTSNRRDFGVATACASPPRPAPQAPLRGGRGA